MLHTCSIGKTARVVGLLLVLISPVSLAWGPIGHAVVADIATQQLSPAAQVQIHTLLAVDNATQLDEVASWPDAIRDDQPRTGAWHYVDIPLAADRYVSLRDCPAERCIVKALTRFTAVLGNASASTADRLRALKFVVHFVGDIHQPLHTADDDDHGGNTVTLRYFGRRTNLHQVWDSRIIERGLGLKLHPNFQFDHATVRRRALALLADTTVAERQRWTAGVENGSISNAVVAWANESHRLAQSAAYGDLLSERRGNWASRYQAAAWPVAKEQLQRAGVRLGALLNATLK